MLNEISRYFHFQARYEYVKYQKIKNDHISLEN